MKDLKKYEGIIPAFYACYDREGKINPAAVRELTQYYIDKGVQGLYVGAPPVNAFIRARKSARWFWRT